MVIVLVTGRNAAANLDRVEGRPVGVSLIWKVIWFEM